MMRNLIALVMLCLGALTGQAQEAVMNIEKTDGTREQTRVAELKQISFLTVEEGGQGLIVTTREGETAAVLFETNPVATISKGKLTIKPASGDALVFEITDIEEIRFGDAHDATAISAPEGFTCVMQDGGALLRGIPAGAVPRIYATDGRSLPTPPLSGGELRLSRSSLGSGVFIVKVGSFAAKISIR